MASPSVPNSKITKSVNRYLDQLHDQNSKLLVLRVDLAYTKEHSKAVGLADIKRDANHLLNNRRSNHTLFENQLGYVMKFEDAPDKGPHIHALFVYDGQQHCKDAHLADQIGRYWNETITDGKGVYHNCNREKKRYDQCGIGMVDYSDTDKRAALAEKVVPYMLKSEQSIAGIRSGKERSMTKGMVPSNKSSAGRPRVHASAQTLTADRTTSSSLPFGDSGFTSQSSALTRQDGPQSASISI